MGINTTDKLWFECFLTDIKITVILHQTKHRGVTHTEEESEENNLLWNNVVFFFYDDQSHNKDDRNGVFNAHSCVW